MNIDFLQKEIIPLREMEIEEGKNCATRQPIYVVLDMYNCVQRSRALRRLRLTKTSIFG